MVDVYNVGAMGPYVQIITVDGRKLKILRAGKVQETMLRFPDE